MRRALALAAALAAAWLLGAAPAPVALDVLLAADPAPSLDAYRLFLDAGGRRPNAGVTPYALNTPLFSDYAEKSRYVFIPPGARARYTGEGLPDFPVGAALVKVFAYPADLRRPGEKVRLVETRLLIRKPEGWTAQAYVWNAEQTKAVLKRAGARLDVETVGEDGAPLSIDYAVPNANQCKECHSLNGVLSPIGPKARNLNGDYAYADGAENQIAHWSRTGLLEGAPSPAAILRTARWDDPAEPLADRARAYLDGNCGHCHNPAGAASNSGLFLDLEEQNPSARGMDKRPVAAGRGSGELEVDIAAGRPDRSILVYRMASVEPGVMMPELGRSIVHKEGLALIRAYVAAMDEPARNPASGTITPP
ncbi:SO2930 family diheme c-type cytochrome [Phenylobacterium sp.]|uniref:SO2930 family diheme c-type cytochrome n=1 Tax=Phenylobacterium sp. TaxID=1871053 RepID=UPI0035AF5EFA